MRTMYLAQTGDFSCDVFSRERLASNALESALILCRQTAMLAEQNLIGRIPACGAYDRNEFHAS